MAKQFKNTVAMRPILLFSIFLVSCISIKDQEINRTLDNNAIVFLVFNIHKDTVSAKNIVELVSKKQSSGKIKDQKTSTVHFENYLSLFLYNNKKLIDSMTIEHPLYKHLEYLDSANMLTVKDVILDKAEFFIRLQLRSEPDQIRFFEMSGNNGRKELNIIKL
jgi:hypothetical protein